MLLSLPDSAPIELTRAKITTELCPLGARTCAAFEVAIVRLLMYRTPVEACFTACAVYRCCRHVACFRSKAAGLSRSAV